MMDVVTSDTSLILWQDLIKHAENKCSITLKAELETYLVSLLMRYTNNPDVVKKIFATAFLEALALQHQERQVSLQHVGDQCLLFAGLFPKVAEKRHVKLSYFVEMGKAAYLASSRKTNDLFGSLALQFVVLMDVLQSIHQYSHLLPLEAYEQWDELGSQRAFNILREYSKGIPLK